MKRTGTKRLAAAGLALALTIALPMQTFAATWYLDEGDITISATETEQSVTQNDKTELDEDPVITQKDSSTATGNTITVETEGKAEAVFTIKDVNIDTSEKGDDGNTGGPAIEIDNSKADITFSGDNTLKSDDSAAIHVSEGSVILKEDNETDTTDTLTAEAGGRYSAGIGSDRGEELSGNITIESGFIAATGTENGAGIGTGYKGDLSGTINITGGEVTGTALDYGAGIGTGASGKLSGSINISGGDVTGEATGRKPSGAGIGTGYRGDLTDSGSINISGGNVVGIVENKINYYGGAGIGTGADAEFAGSINISGGNVSGTSEADGAGIGSGRGNTFTGSINISGDSIVTGTSGYTGAGIGAGYAYNKNFTGSINISGNSNVTASGSGNDVSGAGIGTGYGYLSSTDMCGTVRIDETAQVTIISGGIGVGTGGVDKGYYYLGSDATVTGADSTTFSTDGEYTVVLTVNATCETAGSVTYKNETTGDSYTVPIPATGHTYDVVEVTPATAGHQGYTTYTCSCCNASYISDYTAALPVEDDSDDNSAVTPGNADNTGNTSTDTEIDPPIDDINDATEIIWNQYNDVSAVVPVGTGGYLHESEISEETYAQIITDVTGEVVCTAHLAYSGDNEPHSYKLTFHLDKVYAGRTIRVYLLTDNGERKTWTVTADANGGVTFTTSDLGSFVLAVID